MMIPEIIKERHLINNFGFDCTQYIVLHGDEYYLISQARLSPIDLETLVFPCDEHGKTNLHPIIAKRGLVIDEVWATFGMLLLEAKNDPIRKI